VRGLHDVKRIGRGREGVGQQIVGIKRNWGEYLLETGGREVRGRFDLRRYRTFRLRRRGTLGLRCVR
jgi:hypothetical protein